MDLGLSGKSVVINGGATGIGRACALAFADEGARVAVLDWNADALEATATDLRARGAEVFTALVDVSDGARVDAAHDEVVAAFGSIDVGFNNAGVITPARRIQDMTEDDWDKVMDVNLKGVWLCVRAQVRHMVTAGHGVIINTGSAVSFVGAPGASPYTAAKHAIVGITRTVALELADKNIRVNCVAPGSVETALTEQRKRGGVDPFADALIRQGQPIGRNATVTEVADAVLWLASDRSSFVTGSTLLVDGGFNAQ